MELEEVQERLLTLLKYAEISYNSQDGSYTSTIGYLQAVTDCCVLADISDERINKAKEDGFYLSGVD